jgi:hypothetical protein
VTGTALDAGGAFAARNVDLSHDPAIHQARFGRFFDDTYELVTQDPRKIHVAPGDLQIGPADSGDEHAHETLCGIGVR